MGWNFIYQIARFHKVLAVTRENNRMQIENYMKENPDHLYENITFLYFDLPYWARFWKKGQRGALLYFYLWQRCLPAFIKKQRIHFDITHNVNFHNDWTPSFLWKLQKPFVWGPVGHHPPIPREYLRSYKTSYLVKEYLTILVKKAFWLCSLSLKQTIKRAAHVFCMNQSVPRVLNLERNYSITPSVATQDFGYQSKTADNKFTLITAGRLVPLKGFDLTIKSFARFLHTQSPEIKEKCRLLVIGKGPERSNYIRMAKALNIDRHVTFIDWIKREDLMELYRDASVFVFPSHEGAGMVVAEALSFGLPVLCLDNCGPGEFVSADCGIKVSYKNYRQTIQELSVAISALFNSPDLLNRMGVNARKRFESHFHWDVRGEEFRKVYLKL